jgi:hypothetical protein
MEKQDALSAQPAAARAPLRASNDHTAPLALDLYVDETDLPALRERALGPSATARDRLALAWHLRERDANESAELADAAAGLHERGSGDDVAFEARLALLRAALAKAADDLAACEGLARAVLTRYEPQNDVLLQADACWLVGICALERGDAGEALEQLQRAESLGRVAGDAVRIAIFKARADNIRTGLEQSHDERYVEQLRRRAAAQREQPGGAMVAALLLAAVTYVLHRQGRMAEAGALTREVAALFEQAGSLETALLARSNAALYQQLDGDADGALASAQAVIERAQAQGLMRSAFTARSRMGHLLNEAGRPEQASAYLRQAMLMRQGRPAARSDLNLRLHLIDADLGRGAPDAALALARETEQACIGFGYPLLQCQCVRAQARATARLGRGDDALVIAHRALAMAQSLHAQYASFEALLALAEVHATGTLRDAEVPAREAAAPRGAMLHYLRRAHALMPQAMQLPPHARQLDALGVGLHELAAC